MMFRSLSVLPALLTGLLVLTQGSLALTVDEDIGDPVQSSIGPGGGDVSGGSAGADDAPDGTGASVSTDPFAADYPVLLCLACRDPMSDSVDFGNFAWNAVWGPNRTPGLWDQFAPGAMLKVMNAQGQFVLVWFSDYIHMFGYPTNTMHINVRLPNGQVLTYAVIQVGIELPVGSVAADTTDPGAGGEGSDGEDDAYWNDGADYEYPEPDQPDGIVEILDPDDYGEYPDWFEEL